MPFGLAQQPAKKTAVERVTINAFIQQGRGSGLTSAAEIIRKPLLHLTNNSHFIISYITLTAVFTVPNSHGGKYNSAINRRT
jgi:hypothetical protein